MKYIVLFANQVEEGFWETGTITALKMTSIRQYKPGLKLNEQIKKFA